jgi:hypothetical protein
MSAWFVWSFLNLIWFFPKSNILWHVVLCHGTVELFLTYVIPCTSQVQYGCIKNMNLTMTHHRESTVTERCTCSLSGSSHQCTLFWVSSLRVCAALAWLQLHFRGMCNSVLTLLSPSSNLLCSFLYTGSFKRTLPKFIGTLIKWVWF